MIPPTFQICWYWLAYALPILNIVVPQVGQEPLVAGFPFFIVTALASFISFLALHLTQYPSIYDSPSFRSVASLTEAGHRARSAVIYTAPAAYPS